MTDYQGANVTLMVQDFPAAVTFYSDVLGFAIKMRAGNDWCQLETPGLSLALHPTYCQPKAPGSASTIGLQGADIKVACEDLKGRGVNFTSDVIDTGHLLLANFTDPDGNPMYLAQLTH